MKQSPGLFHKFTPAERTASSASRKCVSFFGIPDLEGFSSCEKAYESVPCANKGLCPFETCKPLKRLDLNFLTSHSGRFFTHAGVLAVFKPRRGRLKIPVAPTGKLKLHVFPLRRAKENKGFSPFNPHAPFKKGSILNFYDFPFRQDFHSRGSFGGFQAPQRVLENTGRSDR